MNTSKRNFLATMFTSLRGKLVLMFIAITVGAVAISTGYTMYMQKQFALKRARERATEDLRLVSSEIQTHLQWIIKDIFVLRDLPQLRLFLETKIHTAKAKFLESTEKAFLALSSHHQIYHQVRFLDETGMERIRVNFDGTDTRLVRVSELQLKSHRYYFTEAVTLQEGEIYISPMDLNIERGAIERPLVPTIRYATPVMDSQGKVRGIIVLNVLGSALLQVLERHQIQAQHHGTRYYLVNTRGYYLFHPDHTKTFGFMLGSGERLERYEPTLMTWISARDKNAGVAVRNSEFSGTQTLFAFRQIPLWTGPLVNFRFSLGTTEAYAASNTEIAPNEAFWILLSAVDEDHLLVALEEYSKPFFLFTVCLLVGCVLVATLVGLHVSKSIVSLAGAARRIQDGDLSARAEIYSKDEMGQFGQLFNSMASKLEQSVKGLKSSESKYRELFENSQDCFFVTDDSGRIIDINKSCAELLGLPYKEGVLSEDLNFPWYDEDSEESVALHESISMAGYVKNYEVHLKRSDGSPVVCLMTANVRQNADGKIQGWEGALRDITERLKRIQAKRNFQKRLQEEIVMAEERERRSMGQVLHEELAQNLALVHMKAQEMEALLPEDESNIRNDLKESQSLLNQMIQQIRTMIFDLYPAMLDEHGLMPTMQWYAESFSEHTGIPVSVYDLATAVNLTRPQEVYLFRTFKELLHNVWKHAEASEALVTVVEKDGSLRLIVDDDGKGFDTQAAFEFSHQIKGIGLFSIREWVTSMEGSFAVESNKGKGTRVLIEVPVLRDAGGSQ